MSLRVFFTIADRVIVLDKEKKGIIAQGSPDYLKNECKDRVCSQIL